MRMTTTSTRTSGEMISCTPLFRKNTAASRTTSTYM